MITVVHRMITQAANIKMANKPWGVEAGGCSGGVGFYSIAEDLEVDVGIT